MAYTAGFSVNVGDPTKASDVTTLAANDDFLKAAVDALMADSATPTSVLKDGVSATTQSPGNDTTKVATTAFVKAAVDASSTSPGGSNTEIQYNNSGAFGASANLTFSESSSDYGLAIGGGDPHTYSGADTIALVGSTSHANSDVVVATSTSGTGQVVFTDTADDTDQGKIQYGHTDNVMIFSTNSAEALRINNEGVLGVKTTPTGGWHTDHGVIQIGTGAFWVDPHDESAANNMVFLSNNLYRDSADEWRAIVTDEITRYYQYNGEHYFDTSDATTAGESMNNNSCKLKIANDGKVGIGTTSPSGKLHIDNSTSSVRALAVRTSVTNEYCMDVTQSSSSFASHVLQLQTANGGSSLTGFDFLNCHDSGSDKAWIRGDGTYGSATNSYGSTSDSKIKQDIVDARKDYWDDFKQVRFRKFRLKDQVAIDSDAPSFLGVVAQEIESIFPSLVTESPDQESKEVVQTDDEGNPLYVQSDELDDDGNTTNKLDGEGNPIPLTEWKAVDLGTTTKIVKYSILNQIGLCVVQELQTRLEAAESKIAALEAA